MKEVFCSHHRARWCKVQGARQPLIHVGMTDRRTIKKGRGDEVRIPPSNLFSTYEAQARCSPPQSAIRRISTGAYGIVDGPRASAASAGGRE